MGIGQAGFSAMALRAPLVKNSPRAEPASSEVGRLEKNIGKTKKHQMERVSWLFRGLTHVTQGFFSHLRSRPLCPLIGCSLSEIVEWSLLDRPWDLAEGFTTEEMWKRRLKGKIFLRKNYLKVPHKSWQVASHMCCGRGWRNLIFVEALNKKSNCPPPKKKSPIRKFDCWMMCLFRCPQTCWNQKKCRTHHRSSTWFTSKNELHGTWPKLFKSHHFSGKKSMNLRGGGGGYSIPWVKLSHPFSGVGSTFGSALRIPTKYIQQKKRHFSTQKWNKRIHVYIQNSSSGGVCLFWLFWLCFVLFVCLVDMIVSLIDSRRCRFALEVHWTTIAPNSVFLCVFFGGSPGWKVMEIFWCFKLAFDM